MFSRARRTGRAGQRSSQPIVDLRWLLQSSRERLGGGRYAQGDHQPVGEDLFGVQFG